MAEKYYRNICFFKNVSTIKSLINMGQFLWFTKKLSSNYRMVWNISTFISYSLSPKSRSSFTRTAFLYHIEKQKHVELRKV